MIILDVETTNLNHYTGSIIEIGAIDLHNPENRFYVDCQAKLDCEITEGALNVNGHTREDLYLSSKPTQLEALLEFDNWLKDIKNSTIIGQNPKFDSDYINQMYSDNGMKSPVGRRTMDLHTLTIENLLRRNEKIPMIKNSKSSVVASDWIMEYVGLPKEPKPHKGINGAIWEAEAFSRLVYGKNMMPEFKNHTIPRYLKK